MQGRPAAPFQSWPAAFFFEDYGFAWWCENAIIVSQTVTTFGNVPGATRYLAFEARMLRERADEVASAGGLYVIHDWRTLTDYDSHARRYWQDQMRTRPKGYLRGSTVCVARVAPLLKMGVQAANLVASITQGVKVELTTDLPSVLAAHKPAPIELAD